MNGDWLLNSGLASNLGMEPTRSQVCLATTLQLWHIRLRLQDCPDLEKTAGIIATFWASPQTTVFKTASIGVL